MNASSAVFISNVDDYLAPSQACVNPLYNNSTETNETEKSASAATPKPAEAEVAAVVVPRQRKRRPRVTPAEGAAVVPKPAVAKDPIKASMADCLACSGCVTTAETVLLEQQHSLTALKNAIQITADKTMVATISPAVWADMLRHLQIPSSEAQVWQQRLVTSLQEILQISYVLDGNIPLQWTLLESAEEFCRAYQHKHNPQSQSTSAQEELIRQWEQSNTPSIAVNSHESTYMLPDGSTQTIATSEAVFTPNLPLLTSSCPALVCLAEKSTHAAVRHLAKTKSPMSLAGAWWRCQNQKNFFHLAFMPCHDKKLEASRKNFLRENAQEQDVDLVLTTQEWFQMLVEYCQNKGQAHGQAMGETTLGDSSKEQSLSLVKAYLESLAPAMTHSQSLTQPAPDNGGSVTLLLAPGGGGTGSAMQLDDRNIAKDHDMEAMDVEMEDNDALDTQNSSVFTMGSGGLAEFVFRYAAWRLFNTHISQVPWKAVETAPNKPNRMVSARIQRRAVAKNRDYYQATLYRQAMGFSCDPTPGAVPVLRFGIAYGLQTVQRILEPFQQSTKNGNSAVAAATSIEDTYPFDFVEAMACPSGCLNGGGQLRVVDRETPTQTRQRVALTKDLFVSHTALPVSNTEVALPLPPPERKTRFHAVPPLAHSMGAAAGVAVKDTQW